MLLAEVLASSIVFQSIFREEVVVDREVNKEFELNGIT